MTTAEKVKQIHSEFHTSFQLAEEQLMNVINKLQEKIGGFEQPQNLEIYNNLGGIFPQSRSVTTRSHVQNTTQRTNKDLQDYLLFKKEIADFKEKFPNYKLISYAQVDEILKKWDLYLGPTIKYVEQIPPQNAKEVVDYLNITCRDLSIRVFANISRPLCATGFCVQETNRDWYGKSNILSSNNKLYICAPMSHFDKKDINILEREIYYQETPTFKMIPATKVMDPIVLAPLVFKSTIGQNLKMFHVVTAWGPESEDSYVREGGF